MSNDVGMAKTLSGSPQIDALIMKLEPRVNFSVRIIATKTKRPHLALQLVDVAYEGVAADTRAPLEFKASVLDNLRTLRALISGTCGESQGARSLSDEALVTHFGRLVRHGLRID